MFEILSHGTKGLERFEGRWMTPEEIKSAQGYVKHEGQWVKKDMLEILKLRGWGERATGLGKALKLHQTANYAVFGDLQDNEIQVVAKTMVDELADFLRDAVAMVARELMEAEI